MSFHKKGTKKIELVARPDLRVDRPPGDVDELLSRADGVKEVPPAPGGNVFAAVRVGQPFETGHGLCLGVLIKKDAIRSFL